MIFQESIHLHGEAHGRVHGPLPAVEQRPRDPAAHLVALVAGVMKFDVGDRPRRRADVVAIHPHDEGDQRPCARQDTEDLVPLLGDLGALEPNEADIVRARVKAERAQGGGVDRGAERVPLLSYEANRGVEIELHEHLKVVYTTQ